MVFKFPIKNKFFEYNGADITKTSDEEMVLDLSNNYIISEGSELREIIGYPKAEFGKYNLNPELSFISYNIVNNFGVKMGELLDQIGEITNKNLSDTVLKTFLIQ